MLIYRHWPLGYRCTSQRGDSFPCESPLNISGKWSLKILVLVFITMIPLNHIHASSQWKLVGEAQLSVLFWDVYQAKLFNDTGQFKGLVAPLALEITYLRSISRDQLLEATEKELKGQSSRLSDAEIQQALATFSNYWPDLSKGDVLRFQLSVDGGRFFYNERFIGDVHSHAIAKAFLNIWLDQDSSYPQLSQQLRGQ